MKKIAVGADHRGYILKEKLKIILSDIYEVIDVGTNSTDSVDYPDIVSAVVKELQQGNAERGIVLCGSGVGASIAANKFKGIRAAICHDTFSAHQGVEDDAMNIICLGGGIIGESLAVEIVQTFLKAEFKPEERYQRRLDKVKKIEENN